MKSRPVTVINGTSTPAKRTLFRIALTVAIVGTIAVSTILILHGALALGRLRYFADVGIHPLHVTSVLLLIFGLLSLLTFIILTIGIVKVNKTFAIIAAVLLGVCSLGLIAISIWSFLTISSGQLPASVTNAIVHEIEQTQFHFGPGNNVVIDNTNKMARLEKQYRCCGNTDPVTEYRDRQQLAFETYNPSSSSSSSSSSSGGSGTGRRTSSTQRNTAASRSAAQLPISCCKERYVSPENLCVDMFANNTNPIDRHNTKGCSDVVAVYKYGRIQRQGFTTIVAAILAVISCIALAAVIRLLGEGYQIVPLRTAT